MIGKRNINPNKSFYHQEKYWTLSTIMSDDSDGSDDFDNADDTDDSGDFKDLK